MLTLVLLDVVLVPLLEVLGQDDVPILPDRVHACLLADSIDVGATDSVWSCNIVLQVNLVAEVHLAGDGGVEQSAGRRAKTDPVELVGKLDNVVEENEESRDKEDPPEEVREEYPNVSEGYLLVPGRMAPP